MYFSSIDTKELREVLRDECKTIKRDNVAYFALGIKIDNELGDLTEERRQTEHDLAIDFLTSSAAIQLSSFNHGSTAPENIIEVRQT